MALDFASCEPTADASSLALSDMMGAGWISSEHLPDRTTKVAIAVLRRPQEGSKEATSDDLCWVFAAGSAIDVFGGDGTAWNSTNVLAYLEKLGLATDSLTEGTIVFPLICPLRLVTPNGVVFIG